MTEFDVPGREIMAVAVDVLLWGGGGMSMVVILLQRCLNCFGGFCDVSSGIG